MPDKHVYFSIGATLGSGIAMLIGKNRHKLQQTNALIKYAWQINKHWFLYFPLIIVICGLWGLIPDILHALHILDKETTRSVYFNVFFMHSWFEQIEDKHYALDRFFNIAGQVLLFSICIGIMLTYVHFIKQAVKRNKQNEQ